MKRLEIVANVQKHRSDPKPIVISTSDGKILSGTIQKYQTVEAAEAAVAQVAQAQDVQSPSTPLQ